MKKLEKKRKILDEFKAFITKGNVVDLAVGVIIGGAFTAIVTALTTNILQPLINWLISIICGGKEGALESARTMLKTVTTSVVDETTGVTKQIVDWGSSIYIDWGAFISAVINFLLVAIVLFTIVKIINRSREAAEKFKALELEKYYERHPEERPAPVVEGAPKPTEADLLTEIRDLLKENKK